jgi:hypothetical protein
METETANSDRQTDHRRSRSDRDRIRNFYEVREMFDGNENAWTSLEWRERMAQAMYE